MLSDTMQAKGLRGSRIASVVPPCDKEIYHMMAAPYFYYYAHSSVV